MSIFSASDPMTRQCPNLGRYEIVSFRPPNAENIENILAVDSEQHVINAEVHAVRIPTTPFPPSQCHHNSVRRMDIGCRTPDRMEFALSCSDETLSGKDHLTRRFCCVSRKLFIYNRRFIILFVKYFFAIVYNYAARLKRKIKFYYFSMFLYYILLLLYAIHCICNFEFDKIFEFSTINVKIKAW